MRRNTDRVADSLLDYFFAHIEYGTLVEFANSCLQCSGTIYFTGVGKSGFISKKVSTMLISIGVKSFFLSPTDALHGDIGILSNEDMLVMFSRSGSTEELIQLCPAARKKGCQIIAVSSERDCKLAAHSDKHIWLPLERELCPFDLAPVTSSTVQLLFGDTLVTALMNAKGLSRDDYAKNHPAGRIGKRLTIDVSHVMIPTEKCPIAGEDERLLEVLLKTSAAHCGCVLVCNAEGSLLGVCTDGDIRRALKAFEGEALWKPISELMTLKPRVVPITTSAYHALQAMELTPKVSVLPVVQDENLAGLVTLHDLLKLGL